MAQQPSSVSPDPSGSNSDKQSQEQLKKAAIYIVGAILIALAGYFGWKYFQNSTIKPDTVASQKYAVIEKQSEALAGSANADSEALKTLNDDIDALVAEHGDSVYAWQALMIKADNAVDANELDKAIEALKKAQSIDIGDAGLQAITQLRYATLLLEKGDIDMALKQASIEVPGSFEASQQELLGDIYLAKKDDEKAIRSYNNAWSLISKRSEDRPLLRLKLQHLGINPDPIEMPPEIVTQQQPTIGLSDTENLNTEMEDNIDAENVALIDSDTNTKTLNDNN